MPAQQRETVSYAKLLLRETNKSLRDIALRLLFVDEATFVDFFCRQTGTTPLDYRRTTHPTLLPGTSLTRKTVSLVVEFANVATQEKTVWLPDGYFPLCDDIQSMAIDRVDVTYANGDIVRVRRFEAVPFKSAMQRMDQVGTISHNKRANTIRFSLAQQTNELTVSVDGKNLIVRVDARVLFTSVGPR